MLPLGGFLITIFGAYVIGYENLSKQILLGSSKSKIGAHWKFMQLSSASIKCKYQAQVSSATIKCKYQVQVSSASIKCKYQVQVSIASIKCNYQVQVKRSDRREVRLGYWIAELF